MTTVTIYPTEDTYIRAAMPDTNFNSSSLLLVQNPWQAAALMRFDLTSIPAGATCTAATLYTTSAAGTDGATTMDVFQIAAAKSAMDISYATWNWYKWGSNWSIAGAFHAGNDYNPTLLGSFTTADYELGAVKTCSLDTAVIATWFGSDDANYGLKLVNTIGSSAHIGSVDHATVGYRPYLEITYTIGPPAAAKTDAYTDAPVEALEDLAVTPDAAEASAFADEVTILQTSIPPTPLNYSGNVYVTTRAQRIAVLALATAGPSWVLVDADGNRATMGLRVERPKANLVPK